MRASFISYELQIGTLPREERHVLDGLAPTDDVRWNLRLDNAAFFVIARAGDLPVGFGFGEYPWGAVGESWAKHVPGALELGGLIVHPEYRRQGIMAELVRLRLEMTITLGYKPVCVTLADNHKVIEYYSSRGWTPRKPFTRNELSLIPWVLEDDQYFS